MARPGRCRSSAAAIELDITRSSDGWVKGCAMALDKRSSEPSVLRPALPCGFVGLLAGTASWPITNRVVADQEGRLLDERAARWPPCYGEIVQGGGIQVSSGCRNRGVVPDASSVSPP